MLWMLISGCPYDLASHRLAETMLMAALRGKRSLRQHVLPIEAELLARRFWQEFPVDHLSAHLKFVVDLHEQQLAEISFEIYLDHIVPLKRSDRLYLHKVIAKPPIGALRVIPMKFDPLSYRAVQLSNVTINLKVKAGELVVTLGSLNETFK